MELLIFNTKWMQQMYNKLFLQNARFFVEFWIIICRGNGYFTGNHYSILKVQHVHAWSPRFVFQPIHFLLYIKYGFHGFHSLSRFTIKVWTKLWINLNANAVLIAFLYMFVRSFRILFDCLSLNILQNLISYIDKR